MKAYLVCLFIAFFLPLAISIEKAGLNTIEGLKKFGFDTAFMDANEFEFIFTSFSSYILHIPVILLLSWLFIKMFFSNTVSDIAHVTSTFLLKKLSKKGPQIFRRFHESTKAEGLYRTPIYVLGVLGYAVLIPIVWGAFGASQAKLRANSGYTQAKAYDTESKVAEAKAYLEKRNLAIKAMEHRRQENRIKPRFD